MRYYLILLLINIPMKSKNILFSYFNFSSVTIKRPTYIKTEDIFMDKEFFLNNGFMCHVFYNNILTYKFMASLNL